MVIKRTNTLLDDLFNDKELYNFKTTVFTIEKAYYQGKLDTEELNRKIGFPANFCNQLINNRKLNYGEIGVDAILY